MDWWKPVAAVSIALVVFGAVGGLVGLAAELLGSVAALAVVALVAVAVLAASGWGTAPNRWLSNPYWGR